MTNGDTQLLFVINVQLKPIYFYKSIEKASDVK